MKIPIIDGIKTTMTDYETVRLKNLLVVPKDTGISSEYINCTDGIQYVGTLSGEPRGAVVETRNGKHYRVQGSELVEVSSTGAITSRGTIAGTGNSPMAYGYDLLAVVGGGVGYLWNGSALTSGVFLQADPTITYSPIDVAWCNQFFFWTDGLSIYQSSLTNPLSITGFADAESSPDGITGLVATRDELIVCGRTTIERFRNVGAGTFTFRSVPGGVLDKGVVSPSAKVRFSNTFAFVGGGAEESPSVWIYGGTAAQKIATRDIERSIASVDATQIVLDYYADSAHQFIICTLPNGVVHVYDVATGEWHDRTWQAKYIVSAYGKWWCSKSGAIGNVERIGSEWGENVRREFSTKFMPASQATSIAKLELKGNWGRYITPNPQAEVETSLDGINWSQPRVYTLGGKDVFDFRPQWRRIGFIKAGRYMAMRFAIDSDAAYQISSLEINE